MTQLKTRKDLTNFKILHYHSNMLGYKILERYRPVHSFSQPLLSVNLCWLLVTDIVCKHILWKHIFVPDEGLAYSLYNGPIDSERLESLPGPTPRTVLEPGAICVLPASVIRHVSKPKDLAFLVRSTL